MSHPQQDLAALLSSNTVYKIPKLHHWRSYGGGARGARPPILVEISRRIYAEVLSTELHRSKWLHTIVRQTEFPIVRRSKRLQRSNCIPRLNYNCNEASLKFEPKRQNMRNDHPTQPSTTIAPIRNTSLKNRSMQTLGPQKEMMLQRLANQICLA